MIIKSEKIHEFISLTSLKGIDLDLKFLKGVKYACNFFSFDDLTDNNIKNYDMNQVTISDFFLFNTMGNDLDFIKNLDTSRLDSMSFFIKNDDITKIDISKWDKTNIRNIVYSFQYCSSLRYADLSGYVKVVSNCAFHGLFLSSKSLEAINIKGWDFSSTIYDSSCLPPGETQIIFDQSLLSSVMIYIDGNMYKYLDKIKKFFQVEYDYQFTLAQWKY